MTKLSETKLRLEWARKVLTSENLIIVTDKEGLMRVGISPDSIDDVIALAQYRATLVNFKRDINSTIKGLDDLVSDIAQEARSSNRSNKGRKIPVKKG